MTGKKIGYIRVSSSDQNPDRQLKDIELDKVFKECASGSNKNRIQLQLMREYVREGDHIFVHSMDRLARSTQDLIEFVEEMHEKKVNLTFVKENLHFGEEINHISMLYLQIFGAFAEFENSLRKERQKEGIEIAKANGKYKGRKPVLNEDQIQIMKDKLSFGFSIAQVARALSVSRATIYNYVRK